MISDNNLRRTKAEQREGTTRALVAAARRLFSERGYANVSLAEIVESTGVTKGALYHHFSGKEGLFRAVLEDVHREVSDRVAKAAPVADPWEQLLAGCRTFLEASTEPGVQQIMLVDAPSVLGWDTWRHLDAETSMRQLEYVLEELIATGVISPQPVAPLAHLLSGAMNEAALWLAHSEQRDRDLADTLAVLTTMVESLRAAAGPSPIGRESGPHTQ